MSKPNMKLPLSSEEDSATPQFYDSNGSDIQNDNDFDDAEQKLRQISHSFPEQQSFNSPLEEAEIDLILQAEDSSIEADLNNWLKNEDFQALDTGIDDGHHHDTITATVIQDNYEVDRTRVLRVAMSGFFTLFILSLLGALLLFFDLQSQVDETRGSLRSLRVQLFGDLSTPPTERTSPLLQPLLSNQFSDHPSTEEVKVLEQNLHIVTDKVSSLEKLLKELPAARPDLKQDKELPTPSEVESGQGQTAAAHQIAPTDPLTPVVSKDRKWTVFLVSLPSDARLDKLYKKFRRSGVVAKRQQAIINSKQWYRLYVTGFRSKEAAGIFAGKASEILSLKGVWVSRLN